MAVLTKTHRERLSKAVDAMPIESSVIGFIGTSELDQLERSLLDATPWKELLTPIDLYGLLGRRARNYQARLPKEYSGPLGNISDSALIVEIKEDIRAFLESLPRHYYIYFQVDNFPKCERGELHLGADVALIDTANSQSDFVQPENMLKNIASLIVQDGKEKLRRNTAYLRFSALGYADSGEDTYSFQRALAKLKHLTVLGAFDGSLKIEWLGAAMTYSWLSDVTRQTFAYVHDVEAGSTERFRVLLPDSVSRHLQKLRINESKLFVSSGQGLLGTKPAETREEKNRALVVSLDFPISFLEIADGEADAQRLRAAIEWYFDGDVTENETIAFLQRCIGIEALLGDDKGEDVVSRLAERFAYLLGRTASDREKLTIRFKKTYKQRSEIVHGRSARLSYGDKAALQDSRAMLAELIWKESRTVLRVIRERRQAANGKAEH